MLEAGIHLLESQSKMGVLLTHPKESDGQKLVSES
jgi:hypothetical protein